MLQSYAEAFRRFETNKVRSTKLGEEFMNANCRLALGLGIVTFAGTALAASDTPDTALQEIVVTAQKRSENLQDVPIAISAISGDSLAAANASSITALADVTP